MTRPRLSIVMCTYNGAAYLQPQLDSLLAQTRLPDEIVIGDDGSTDATMDILRRFDARARQAGIQVVLRQNPQNLGYVVIFPAGLRQTRGPFLSLFRSGRVWRA